MSDYNTSISAVDSLEDQDAPVPSWKEIKQKHWADIEARYLAGARDKKTVCAWMAYKAALAVCKGWGRGSFDELLTEGYQTAVKRWPHYDPTKATKNGISGFLYKAAQGRMRNAAQELFTSHGKRRHRKGDVIPTVSVVADIEPHVARQRRSAVTAPRAAGAYAHVDYFTNKADVGGINDKAVTAAVNKAARSKSFKLEKWTTKVRPPLVGDRNASRLARIAVEIHVYKLLALLPPDDRKLITQYWGVEGVETATLEELAERKECSVDTMRRSLDKLYIELKVIATRSKHA